MVRPKSFESDLSSVSTQILSDVRRIFPPNRLKSLLQIGEKLFAPDANMYVTQKLKEYNQFWAMICIRWVIDATQIISINDLHRLSIPRDANELYVKLKTPTL